VDVRYLGHTVGTLGLVTTRDVPEASLVKRVTDELGPPLAALALALVVLGGLVVGLWLRATLTRRPKTASSP
jgi:hypothetical protein